MAELGNINARESDELHGLLVGQGLGHEGVGLGQLVPANRMSVGRVYNYNTAGGLTGVDGALSLKRFHALLLGAENANKFGGVVPWGDVVDAESYNIMRTTAQGSGKSMDKITRPWLINTNPGSKISQEVVAAYEQFVDLEYVPFTIQDLRTNEIISLPAFISSISDDFAADYSNTQGYGRTDPVWTYSKTTRSISLTFTLAAMNEGDFEYMWFVINKLVTMLYPQRSAGRTRTYNAGTKRFIQPFSQVPTASPVIRMRLGELFHTNYSVQGLAQLFGDGSVLDLDAKKDDPEKIVKEYRNKIIAGAKENMKTGVEDELTESFKSGEYDTSSTVTLGVGTKVAVFPGSDQGTGNPNTKKSNAQKKPGNYALYSNMDFTVEKNITELPAKEAEAKASKKKIKPPVVTYRGKLIKPAGDFSWGAALRYKKNNQTGILTRLKADAGDCMVSVRASSVKKLIHDEGIVQTKLDAALKERFPDDAEAIAVTLGQATARSEFFSSDKNAIVRSFGASMGRGLAGVITQMGLDYAQGQWGTEAQERNRAPARVDVTLSFSPIHDLPLGLDKYGEMSAPSHPVGGLNKDPRMKYGASEKERAAPLAEELALQGIPSAKAAEAKVDEQEADEP